MKLFIFLTFFLVSNCNDKEDDQVYNNSNYESSTDSIVKQTDAETFQHENNLILTEINEEQSNTINDLETKNNSLYNQLDNETQKMFTYGTKRQLFDNGILERGGLFSNRHINENLNLNNFEKISINKTEICLANNINKIFPERKESSYTISGNCLYITNPNEFWEVVKILVIETEE